MPGCTLTCNGGRRKILTGDIANWEIIALDVMPDHVHLFVSAPPKY
ncbi:MAG: transposase, partial [Clostridia bacterium]|nr:transposase [Clostridia bacterium]